MKTQSLSQDLLPNDYDSTITAGEQLSTESPTFHSIEQMIFHYMKLNCLIRFIVHKGRGVIHSLPGRIVGYDTETQILTIYHVDEKQVYAFTINQFEDLIPCH